MVSRQHQRDDGDVRGIEDVLAVDPDEEFAADRNKGGQRGNSCEVGPE